MKNTVITLDPTATAPGEDEIHQARERLTRCMWCPGQTSRGHAVCLACAVDGAMGGTCPRCADVVAQVEEALPVPYELTTNDAEEPDGLDPVELSDGDGSGLVLLFALAVMVVCTVVVQVAKWAQR